MKKETLCLLTLFSFSSFASVECKLTSYAYKSSASNMMNKKNEVIQTESVAECIETARALLGTTRQGYSRIPRPTTVPLFKVLTVEYEANSEQEIIFGTAHLKYLPKI